MFEVGTVDLADRTSRIPDHEIPANANFARLWT